MLGHQLFKHLRQKHEVTVTLHQELTAYEPFGLFHAENSYANIDVRFPETLHQVFSDFHPQAVVNAVGIIKQRNTAKQHIPCIEINSLFPHRLTEICENSGARMIHLSTDCVFSGARGRYREEDVPDAVDVYGRSKLLGEVDYSKGCLTLRTSMIGPELLRKKSLLEWFLSQKGDIRGFKRAIFSGFTTMELSRIIEKILVEYPEASGLYHVSSHPISKYALLSLIRAGLGRSIRIESDEDFFCDRSLVSEKFRSQFNYQPPSWPDMIEELCSNLLSA
ncbi:MAG: SDR family oxidoreductase [Desulfobacterales bacterium]|nr:SDR family oxidoreductase [Desulfobacterales bacterium]